MSNNENVRYLQYSARRYKVNQYGEILENDKIIEPYLKDDHLTVSIDWVFGRAEYKVAILIMFCFKKLSVPEHLLGEVTPLYVDGNIKNISPGNLIYKFKDGKLEVEAYKEYYYIPFFSEYAINEKGSIINVKTGREKLWSVIPPNNERNKAGGYFYTRVTDDEGSSKILYLHRALCLVFKDYDRTVNSLVVNHRNGIATRNELDNLEWTTYRENNLHAVQNGLSRKTSTPIIMKDLKTGEELRFTSIVECAKHLGHFSYSALKRRVNSTKIYADMLVFKTDNSVVWPELDRSEVEKCAYGRSSDIVARNVFTGQKLVFIGAHAGEQLTSVDEATILTHLRSDAVFPVKGWNFRYLDFDKEWPNHTVRHLEIYKDSPYGPGNGVTMFDDVSKEEIFFTSLGKCANHLKIGSSKLNDLIKYNEKLRDRYTFKLFDIRKELGLPIE